MRKIVYTKALINLVSGCIFDGLTDTETALLSGIPVRQISRLRAGDDCPEIKRSSVERMRKYIALIRDGEDRSNRWQRIAWFLERRYPDRWAKPEVLLNVSNNTANTTNNTLVITAEQASNIKARNADLDQELQKLVPPASRANVLATELVSASKHSNASLSSNETAKDSVVLAAPTAPAGGTPDAAPSGPEPHLAPTAKSVTSSSNSKEITDSTDVENSSNYKTVGIPPEGIKRGRGRPRKIPSGIAVEKPQSIKPLEPLEALDTGKPSPPPVSEKLARKLILEAKGNPPKIGPLGERLPTKKELREKLEKELAELKRKKKVEEASLPRVPGKTRKRVPPKIVLRPRVVKAMRGVK